MQEINDIFDIAGIETEAAPHSEPEAISGVALVAAEWTDEDLVALRNAANRMQKNPTTATAATLLLDALKTRETA